MKTITIPNELFEHEDYNEFRCAMKYEQQIFTENDKEDYENRRSACASKKQEEQNL